MHNVIMIILLLSGNGTSTVIQHDFETMIACTDTKNDIENQLSESKGSTTGSNVPIIVTQGCYPSEKN